MRDPGTPRRNPLFDHGVDDWLDDDDELDDPGAAPSSNTPIDLSGLLDGHDHADSAEGERGFCALCVIGSLFTSLRDAQPEAIEHFLGAAHEFLEATKVVVDAADRAVQEQRAAAAAEAARRRAARGDAGEEASETPPPRAEKPKNNARVRRIDIA